MFFCVIYSLAIVQFIFGEIRHFNKKACDRSLADNFNAKDASVARIDMCVYFSLFITPFRQSHVFGFD